MKKKNLDLDKPFGKLRRVKDFLPAPDELSIPEETAKVTIHLRKSDIDFFKNLAKKHHAKYQKIIRELLSTYTTHYSRV